MADPKTARQFLIASSLSLAVLFGSMAWAFAVGERANDQAHELMHAREALATAQGKKS